MSKINHQVPIRTEAQYTIALREVSSLVDIDPLPESEQGKRLCFLGALVQEYERIHFPIPEDSNTHQTQGMQ